MAPATDERPQDTFSQREGDALLCMGSTMAIQLALVVGVLYFTSAGSQPEPAPSNAPILRPGIHPSAS